MVLRGDGTAPGGAAASLRCAGPFESTASPCGRIIEPVPIERDTDGRKIADVRMDRFAVWTLRCELA